MTPTVKLLDHTGRPFASTFSGGGSGFGEQLATWAPRPRSVDAALLPNLQKGNARAEDLVRNHGLAQGGVQLHIDNIVGHLYRPSSKPRWKRLGITEEEARQISTDMEALYMELVEDPTSCWIDAERKRTGTMMIREAVGNHVTTGEIMATAEWITDRPAGVPKTAIKTVNSHRVCNPNQHQDTDEIRAGIKHDKHGAAVSYFVRSARSNTLSWRNDGFGETWTEVPRETAWGRQQFLHVFEPTEDGQTRGANKFLSILEQCHMLSKLQNTKLQNAIVNSMYAATIESELGGEQAMEIIGGGEGSLENYAKYLGLISTMSDAANIRMNGVRIPHLIPGEKINLTTSSNADNGFAELEASIIRYLASGLGVSYEQLARDYSKTNYSSARASIMESWRYFMGRRKVIASRYASMIWSLVMEEAFMSGWIKLPRKAVPFHGAKAAWCNVDWIGSGRIAIDGLKEVKESVLRIESGLSTYEKELALLGEDYQETFAQQVREMKERSEKGLPPPSWMRTQMLAPDAAEAATSGDQ
jgi:lambda family phage portal protein